MTAEEKTRLLQILSFAYGNLALTTNHKPQKKAFRWLWEQKGLPKDEFEYWAAKKQWRDE